MDNNLLGVKAQLSIFGSVGAMIDRRNFLILTGATLILTGATAILLKLPEFSFTSEAEGRLVRIITYIPRRIFFSTRAPGAPVFLTTLELIDEDKTVSCSFSNGKTTQFDSNCSSLNIIQKSEGRRFTRQSVLPKSLAAWVIDAVWQSAHNKLNPTTIAQLRSNFEGFQRQSVLEAVTPVSLYNLVRESALSHQITSIVWNGGALRFEVK